MRILSNLSVSGLLGLNSVADANTDTDKFLVLDSSGIVRYRTGSEVFSDIGAGGAAAYTSVLQHTVKAGVALTKGQAVYVTGADGTNMIVGKASNASEATSSKTLGLIVQNLAINDQGFVITEGLLAGLDTSTAVAGDPVWLGTDGNLIFGLLNKPYAPAHLVFIGIVTRVQQNNGEIFVKVQNGFELQELHNVQITSTPSDNTVLAYETSTSLYKMKSIPTLLGYTPTTNARNITINGTTYDLSADRSWSVGTHTGNLTTGYVPKATGATTLTDSLIYDNGSAIGINTSSPYESSAFKLDVNGGLLIKNTSGTAAQLILINSNPATGGNNGFVQLSAGGNTATAFGQWQTYYGMSVASGALRLQPAGGQVLIGTTTTSAFLTDINGTLRVSGQLTLGSTISNNTYVYTMPGATGTLALVSDIPSLSGYVPTSRTLTINGTSYDLSADRSWTIAAGVSAVQAGSGISVSTSSGVVTVVNTGLLSGTAGSGISVSTSGQNLNIVNTGLLSGTAGSGISVSTSGQNLNIVNTGLLSATAGSGISVSTTSQNVNIVNTGLLSATAGTGISVSTTSGTLNIVNTITNTNQLTNGAGYITGITSGMVTTALGYTPYNATNPNGYISSYTETDTLASVTGRGSSTSTPLYFSGGSSTTPALHIRSGGTNWSEGLAIHPLTDNSYALAFFRTKTSYTDNTDTWALGNMGETGIINHFALLRRGLTGSSVNVSGNAVFAVNPNGTFSFGFTPLVGTNTILHAGNYNSYSPTLTGGGASGTWGINITGSSRSLIFGGDSAKALLDNVWAGTGGFPGYQFTGGNSRFGFSSTSGVIDVYADGNFYATDSGHLVWHAGNLTNLNQLSNGPGYITGYTETDTLQSVTNRGASTTAAITISREAFSYGGTTQSFLISGAGGNGALTINSASAYAYLNFAQGGTTKMEMGIIGTAGARYGSLYINRNIQVGESGASIVVYKSNGFVGINNVDPGAQLDVNGTLAVSGVSTFNNSVNINGVWQTTISTSSGSWNKLSFTASNKWGDGTEYGTLGASGGAEPGVMINNMHATWHTTDNGAGIRMGRSGGVSSGAWYQVATMSNDEFMIARNGTWANGGIKILSNGAVNYGNTGYRFVHNNGTWDISVNGTANSETLATVTARGATTSTATVFTGGLFARRSQTAGNYTTAALWTESYDNTTTGIAFHISGNQGKFLEMRTNGILYWHGDTVWHSGNLTNLNQLSNGPGYITASSYVAGLNLQGLGSGSMNVNNGGTAVYRNENGLGGNLNYAPVLHLGGGDTMWQIQGDYYDSTDLRWRAGYAGSWYAWRQILHSANYQNYALPLTGGTVSGAVTVSNIFQANDIRITTGYLRSDNAIYNLTLTGSAQNVWAKRMLISESYYGNDGLIPFGSGLGKNTLWVHDFGASRKHGAVISCDNNGEAHIYAVDFANSTGDGTIGGAAGGWGWNMYYDGANSEYFRMRIGVGGTWTEVLTIDSDRNVRWKNTTGFSINGNIVAHSGNIGSQSAQIFNNMGQSHGTRTSFDASSPSYDFGFRYIQGLGNGPGTGGGAPGQFYSLYMGLGIEYPSTGSGSYGMYLAIDRNSDAPYLSVRYNENNSLTSWRKIRSGYADVTPLVNAPTFNQPAVRVNSSGTGSAGSSIAIQQITGEGWTGVFVDFEPNTGWGLYHDNPNNYFCVTAEATTGSLRSFTVPSRESGNRTAHEKIRFDQNNGSILAGGDITAFSDGRIKTNVEVVGNPIEKIKQIRGVTFLKTNSEGEDKNKRHAGVIAQEVLEVLPEVVNQDKDTGMYNVAYGNLAALFIEAIKEQQKQIEELKSKLDAVTK